MYATNYIKEEQYKRKTRRISENNTTKQSTMTWTCKNKKKLTRNQS